MIVDSHCHLNILDEEKVGDIQAVIQTAKELVLKSVCLAWLEHQLADFDVNNKNEENVFNVFNLLKGPLIRGSQF